MLVLTRKTGESVVLETAGGETITVKVLRSVGPVRIGIEAGSEWLILRSELRNRGGERQDGDDGIASPVAACGRRAG